MNCKYFVFFLLWGCLTIGCQKQQPLVNRDSEAPKSNVDHASKKNSSFQKNNYQLSKNKDTPLRKGEYLFPELESIASLEYMMQGEQSWHPIARELWPEIANCFRGNQKGQELSIGKGLYVSIAPFAYYLRIKHLNGEEITLLSVFSSGKSFTVDASSLPLLFKGNQGKRLQEILGYEVKWDQGELKMFAPGED